MTRKYVRDWDKRANVFLFEANETRAVSASEFPNTTDGFIKYFLFGKSIVVFKTSDNWFIKIGKKELPLEKIDSVELEEKGPFASISVKANGIVYKFTDFSLFNFFARKFDPTYDRLDEELVFGFWLKDQVEKSRYTQDYTMSRGGCSAPQ